MATKNTVGAVLINDSPVVTEATVSATSIDTSLPYMNLVGEWYVNGSKVITEATLPSGGGDAQSVLNALIDGSITEFESDVTSVRQSCFRNAANLKIAIFPSALYLLNDALYMCQLLHTVIAPSAKQVNPQSMAYCYSLTKVVIGTSQTTVAKLGRNNTFTLCYHILGTTNSTYNPTGAKDGYIYVPLSLVADYRSATNWAEYATQIMPYVATVEELANIDGTTYDKACVGADYVEYTYNGTSWELYTRS